MRRHLPGFAPIANLSITTKLALIVIVLALPICALMFVQYQQRQEATSQAASESHGLDYVASVIPFLREVQLHRGLVERVNNGDDRAVPNRDRTAEAADTALAAINDMDSHHGDEFATHELVAFLNSEWARAKGADANSNESSVIHNSLIQQGVFPLLSTVADESELALDPDLENRNVIVTLTETLPRLTEALSQMRNNGASTLTQRANQPAPDDVKQYMAGQWNLAQYYSDQLTRQLESAMAGSERFETDLRPIATRSDSSRKSFLDTTRSQIMTAATLSAINSEGYFLLGGSSIDQSNQLLTSAQEALKADFNARTDDASSEFTTYGALAAIGIVLALGLAVFIAATITRPLKHLADVADRMSLGELDVDIDVEGTNEIGQLAESLRRMQASLRSAIERLRQRRAAAA